MMTWSCRVFIIAFRKKRIKAGGRFPQQGGDSVGQPIPSDLVLTDPLMMAMCLIHRVTESEGD